MRLVGKRAAIGVCLAAIPTLCVVALFSNRLREAFLVKELEQAHESKDLDRQEQILLKLNGISDNYMYDFILGQVRTLKAHRLSDEGRMFAALKEQDLAIAAAPEEPQIYCSYAHVLLEHGDWQGAAFMMRRGAYWEWYRTEGQRAGAAQAGPIALEKYQTRILLSAYDDMFLRLAGKAAEDEAWSDAARYAWLWCSWDEERLTTWSMRSARQIADEVVKKGAVLSEEQMKRLETAIGEVLAGNR